MRLCGIKHARQRPPGRYNTRRTHVRGILAKVADVQLAGKERRRLVT